MMKRQMMHHQHDLPTPAYVKRGCARDVSIFLTDDVRIVPAALDFHLPSSYGTRYIGIADWHVLE